MKHNAEVIYLHESGEYVNSETGEITKNNPTGAGLTWFRGMRKGFKTLAKMKLSAIECAVFFDLAGHIKMGNVCLVNQHSLATSLGFDRSSVHRALNKLESHRIIEKHAKTGTLIQYRINPVYCWLGPTK